MNSPGLYKFEVHVLGVKDEAIIMDGSYADARSFDEVEKRLSNKWILIRGQITHKPMSGGEITRTFVRIEKGPKPRINLAARIKEIQQVQATQEVVPPPGKTENQQQVIYIPRETAPYVAPKFEQRPDPVAFLAAVEGLKTIDEEDIFAEKIEPYTYKAPVSKRQQRKELRAAEKAAQAAAVRTAN